ncbi:unnamed protein product [[Actinomadura] parvosata subsp. kistnae]|uniref:Serine peptidase n=2 Tax=Nonomuraea TaxID=83681 RepID=A0A1V0A2Y0_9ACTN|nr:hypothetical protein [Nonomuraea sp. ATCC 55076]AQZ64561.1 hypothetical protein BKM31_26630 [Nonomuraea sp. ATCC 55076]NJP88050.1 hypothetical protein [Nonomuraea sp. FMUSA5-5]SPL99620.1 unnamed protein product [Actinomadura parvosata subsp. kistnae]
MAVIVGVHGIGKYNYYLEAGRSATGAAEAMRRKWDRYLHIGLGGEPRAYFAEIAYFSHLLHDGDDGYGAYGGDAPRKAMELQAQQVLVDWARHLGVGEHVTGALKSFTGWLLERLDSRSAAFAKLFAPEVAAYLTDQARREKSRRAVAECIRKNRPKVVIAHSLGSVVAYEALWAEPDLEVDLLLTLGSPLGMRNVIFERLLPAPVNGRGERPRNVKRWVNIADKDDIAAIPPALAASFTGVDVEQLVNLDWIDFHTAEKYLGCPALDPHLRPFLA